MTLPGSMATRPEAAAAGADGDEGRQAALCLLATEWWKSSRRLLRLALEAAPGRLERERAQVLYSMRRIEEALQAQGYRLHGFDGQAYSPSLPVEPVNPEDFSTEEGLVVAETIEPTILRDGRILVRGRVVLAEHGTPLGRAGLGG